MWQSLAGHGLIMHGRSRRCELTQDKEPFGVRNTASEGMKWQGMAWRGDTRRCFAGIGTATLGKFYSSPEGKMIHEKSSDTKIVESVLREAKIGETISYERLSKAIGRDVRQFAQCAIRTARNALIKEKIVFGVEANVGLVRLNDSEIVKSTEHDRQRLKRIGRKSLRKLEVVDYNALTPEDKRRHTTAAAQMGAIEMFASKATTNRIESKVTADTKVLAIGETLSLFVK